MLEEKEIRKIRAKLNKKLLEHNWGKRDLTLIKRLRIQGMIEIIDYIIKE